MPFKDPEAPGVSLKVRVELVAIAKIASKTATRL